MTRKGPTFVLGRVLTMAERSDPEAAGLVVRGGEIVRLLHPGEEAGLPPGSDVLDFGSRRILPGFLDGHAHLEVGATAALAVDCRPPTVGSISDILDSLRDHLGDAEARAGWLVGQGSLFLDQKLPDGRLPNRRDLDRVSREVAIVIRAGGHVSCLNSRAIELAGLHDFTPSQSTMGGPLVERGPDGQPTGIVAELDAVLPIPPLTPDQLREAIRSTARDLFLANGVTHVCEVSETLQGLRLLDELVASGEIQTRFSLALWAPGTLPLEQALLWPEHLTLESEPERMHVRGVKIFADGGFSARTAAMLTPYVTKQESSSHAPSGQLAMPPAVIGDAIRRIVEAGLQPIIHTCGEAATRAVAEACRGIRTTAATQVRVEHAGHLFVERDRTFALMHEADLRPMPNPGFLHTIGPSLPTYVGERAVGNRFLFRDMLNHGFRISGSSDLHVGSHPSQTNPFFMMWCSVARVGFDGSLVDPEQAIDVTEALKMHTLHAAEALGVANRSGSLEPGKDADFVVLDRDPCEIRPDELRDVQVDYVFVNGDCVYEREGATAPDRRIVE